MITQLNVVTCGKCGEIFAHTGSPDELTCPYCRMRSDVCDFPDLWYGDDFKNSIITVDTETKTIII